MARSRKKTYDPRQLTFNFDVTADQIEQLRRENTHADAQEAHNARQTNSSAGNSPHSAATGNHSRGMQRGVHQFSLFDFGQVGAEPAGRAALSGSAEHLGINSNPEPATNTGSERTEQRFRVESESAGDERLGDFAERRNRYQPENYHIVPEDRLGHGGAKSKFADNIAAIRLLKDLQERKVDVAGPDEKKILVRYVGWGGLPQAFDARNEKWAAEYQELQSLLAPDEYAKARRSTQDAHFTSETVIRGIYQGLNMLGLREGGPLRVLEPSAGIGNFMGLMPEGYHAQFLAVELDPTTAAIGRYLYPHSWHINNAFQNAELKDACFDLVVGNPPFGKQTLYDPNFPELRNFTIHNYFLAKSLSLLRPGGIGAFVVSRFFMDAADPTARAHIAGYADLLGAVRLPETAFRQNALTDVTTDILFFRRHDGPAPSPEDGQRAIDWVQTTTVEAEDKKEGGTRPAVINNYFTERPGQIIGSMVYSGGMFQNSLNCVAPSSPDFDLGQEIEKRLRVLPPMQYTPRTEIVENSTSEERDEAFIASEYFQSLKMGAYCVEPQSRKIVFKVAGSFGDASYTVLPVKNDGARQRLTPMIQIRDSLRELLNAEKNDAEEPRIEAVRKQLNVQYDAFVRRYGHLNSQMNRSLMRDDPEHSLLESLELEYDKGLSKELAKRQGREFRPASARKAAIFRQRVLKPTQTAEKAETTKDALVISLRESGKVDFARMTGLLHRPAETIQKELQDEGLIFRNPTSEDWEIRDKYLTGNVREKHRAALAAAAENPQYHANVEALAAAIPPDIEAVDIGVKFGSTWVPGNVFSDFIEERIHGGRGYQTINYVPILGRWEAKVSVYDHAVNTEVWGIPEYPAAKILESLLTNRPIKVEKESGQYDDHDRPIMVVDQELTAAAMQKADELKQAFLDWVWTDDERRTMLTTLYNERFNTHVPPRYDGSHIQLVGASSDVSLRPHQKDAVWRSIQEGTALFDHVVGAGKTMACIATIMESKRMGFLNKPMVVVPNHLLYQWRDEFYKLYPGANILVADKNDFTKQNRERLFSRVATGDWDAVVVAHSSFKKIDMPRDMQAEILQEQIDAVITAIEESQQNDGGRATIKQLEKQREKMETRYEKLMAGNGIKDRAVDFADLGVDALFVDESHEFKNLSYTTTMNVSGLGNITGSAKALDMFIKCRYLQKQHEGRGVYFMTGTPISNTIAEVYTLQRYLQMDELKAKNIEYFDAWASTFGQITNGWELDATGVNYKLKSRFASFQNVPELLSMYRSFADVVTKNDLDEQAQKAGMRPLTPPVDGGKPFNHVAERSSTQAAYMEQIIERMEHLPKDPRLDNPLKITNDARKAGLDYRLINPESGDYDGSKSNAAVERIFQIWQNTAADRGTQLVFCDLSTPKGGAGAAASVPSPRLEFEEENFAVQSDAEPGTDEQTGEDAVETGDSEGADDSVAADMDACVADGSRFSVYDDIWQKLMERGIPADEIAFIHDANTDIRKGKLFSDMQAGRVRILLGSTAKMGAGMNVQKRLVAAHHLDAPWRPSDLEQRNGRIVRQGNMLYERDPDKFAVGVYYYATKQTYDARMWQTIEYKAAAIEQFRTGDLLQRVIDDVQSEAANAADMKAAASGNPLILIQVKLASDLRKLEALHSQHQRSQHRLRDRLKWLGATEGRLAKAQAGYAANCSLRDGNTHTVTEKGKTRIRLEWLKDGKLLTEKNGEQIQNILRDGVKDITRESRAKPVLGKYRGFEVSMRRTAQAPGGDGFRLTLKGMSEQEFQPENLVYGFDEKFSLSGMFQRLDNFLDKGLEQSFQNYQTSARQEMAEMNTAKAALGQEFPQQGELALVRENYSGVMRELKRMQDEPGYVSEWEPKEKQWQQVATPLSLKI